MHRDADKTAQVVLSAGNPGRGEQYCPVLGAEIRTNQEDVDLVWKP